MRVYATGGSEKETSELMKICSQKGWQFKAVNRIGRPKLEYSVKNVLNAYSEVRKVRAATRKLKMNPGTVYRILKEQRVLEIVNKRSTNV